MFSCANYNNSLNNSWISLYLQAFLVFCILALLTDSSTSIWISIGNNMKKVFIFLISAAFVVFSCTNSSYERLEEIETFINENPDSAKAALDAFMSVDSTLIKTGREKALFSLMKVMLKDKNYINVVDPDEIEPAVVWYAKHNRKDRYPLSLYYQGLIHFYRNENADAFMSFMESKNKTCSLKLRLMSTMMLGYTCNGNYLPDEALSYCLDALTLSEEYGDTTKLQQARLNLASAYNNKQNNQAADSLLLLICQSIPEAYILRAEYHLNWENPDYKKICDLFETGKKYKGVLETRHEYQYAFALYKCDEREEAKHIVDSLSAMGENEVYSCHWTGKIAEEEGNLELALKYARTEIELIDSTVMDELDQSLYKKQMEYDRNTSETKVRNRNIILALLVLLSMLLLLLIVALVIIHRARRDSLKNEIDRMLGIVEESNRMLHNAQKESEEAANKSENSLMELRRIYARLYQKQFSEIGQLFDYGRDYESIGEEAVKKYLRKTAEIISEINQGSEHQSVFENRINSELDNIMLKLRKDFPEFKESDFRFLSYVIVGFDATTRAIILNETPNNMRVKKARLLKKIFSVQNGNTLLYSCFLHPEK